MEEDQNKGVDLSHYLDSRKANVFAKLSNLDKDKEEKEKNKIYLAIIGVCFLIMAILWGYYSYQQNAKNQTTNYGVSGEVILE
ncbi:MAG: hypothetical protein WA093_01415 [Minisyncoccales bacterium]|jgi:predicted membrane protein